MAELIRSGVLIPVAIFGGDTDCACGRRIHWGYGVMDRFSTHSPAGSDCNRADAYLLRPSDKAMDDPAVKAALNAVLELEHEDEVA